MDFSATVNFGKIIRQIGIIQFVAQLIAGCIGFILGLVGFAMELTTSDVDSAIDVVSLVSIPIVITVMSIIYYQIGIHVAKSTRWIHLSLVGVGLTITSIFINFIILGVAAISLAAILVNGFEFLVPVGISGAMVNATRK